MITRRICLLLMPVLSALAGCSALVPLIGWSNSDAFSSVKGSQISSAQQFIYDASLEDVDMIVIFKSPELSFDSLAKYAGGYDPSMSSLQSEVESSKSNVWVGVDGNVASDLVSTLSFILDVEPRVITGADGLTKQQKLVLVELLPTSEGGDSFSEQDDIISQVMSALHSLPGSPIYAAIFTSSHTHLPGHTHMPRPSNEQREIRRRSADGYRAPRALKENDDTTTALCAAISNTNSSNDAIDLTSYCMLFCFSEPNITLIEYRDSDKSITYHTASALEFLAGSCSNASCEVGSACVHANANFNGTSITLTFAFYQGACSSSSTSQRAGNSTITCGFWTMELYVAGQRYTRATEERRIFSEFSVPQGNSYACGDNTMNVFRPYVNETLDNLVDYNEYQFHGLQVQYLSGISVRTDSASQLATPVFGTPYNCESYVSTVPLMGIVGVLVLFLILYGSLLCLFSIKTMDRFDDPRGPTISVENLH